MVIFLMMTNLPFFLGGSLLCFLPAALYFKGSFKKAGERLFKRECSDRTREHGLKLKKVRFGLDIRKKFFTVRVVKHWNNLPREVRHVPSLRYSKPGWLRP